MVGPRLDARGACGSVTCVHDGVALVLVLWHYGSSKCKEDLHPHSDHQSNACVSVFQLYMSLHRREANTQCIAMSNGAAYVWCIIEHACDQRYCTLRGTESGLCMFCSCHFVLPTGCLGAHQPNRLLLVTVVVGMICHWQLEQHVHSVSHDMCAQNGGSCSVSLEHNAAVGCFGRQNHEVMPRAAGTEGYVARAGTPKAMHISFHHTLGRLRFFILARTVVCRGIAFEAWKCTYSWHAFRTALSGIENQPKRYILVRRGMTDSF